MASGGAAAGGRSRDSRSLTYRPDIDGLRAVAVLSVLLAHAGATGVSAGFLGVDVFFVISGYLITTILLKELGEERCSLIRFYERRARRILPPLIVVIVVCVPFAFGLMLPEFLQNFGQSVVATLAFSNNVLLALTTGYWQLESGFKPLLHAWSLGVEEQFYVIFPSILIFAWRFGRRAQIGTILLLGVVSFAISEHGWRTYREASFFLPTSRAWELMVGCGIAYVPLRPRRWDNLAAVAALTAVIASMVVLDETIPSPSIYSAVPVLGAAGIVLFSRPGTLVCRLLSLRPVVFVGLISYSAYLWHQPLFAFARVASLEPPGGAAKAVLLVLALVLATLSWRFIEVPSRNAAAVPLRRFVPAIVIPTACLVGLGLVLHFEQGFPRRAFPNIDSAGDVYITYNERIRQFSAADFPRNGRANILLLGNSFARDVGNVLIESGAVNGKNLVYLENYHACEVDGNTRDVEWLLSRASVVVVGLSQDIDCVRWIARRLARTARVPVVYFGPKDFGYNINPFARVPMERRDRVLANVEPRIVRINDVSTGIVAEDRYVDVIRLLGPDGRRIRFFDARGNPLTPDGKHLTRYGAVFLANLLRSTNPPAFRTISAAEAAPGNPRPNL